MTNQEIIALIEANEIADTAKIEALKQAGFKKVGHYRMFRDNISISLRFAAYSMYATVKVDKKKVQECYLADLDVNQF